MDFIHCTNLIIGYDVALLHVEKLIIKAGNIFPLIGANSSGKTSLLKTLSGFQPKLDGNIEYGLALPHIAYLPETPTLFPNLTVFEHLHLVAQYHGNTTSLDLILNQFELSAFKNHLSHTLSTGKQKCLCFAALAISRPKVLLLDEPTADLDPEHRAVFHRFIYDACQKGAACIFATHIVEDHKLYDQTLQIHQQHLTQKVRVQHDESLATSCVY